MTDKGRGNCNRGREYKEEEGRGSSGGGGEMYRIWRLRKRTKLLNHDLDAVCKNTSRLDEALKELQTLAEVSEEQEKVIQYLSKNRYAKLKKFCEDETGEKG